MLAVARSSMMARRVSMTRVVNASSATLATSVNTLQRRAASTGTPRALAAASCYPSVAAKAVTALPRSTTMSAMMPGIVRLSSLSSSSFIPVDVPENDYYHGHLLTDHLEYLDDILETTLKLEVIRQEMDQIRLRKKGLALDPLSQSNEMNLAEVEALFRQAEQKSADAQSYLASLKEIVESAQQKHNLLLHEHAVFAVDAPDGQSDAEGMTELQGLVDSKDKQ